MVDFLEGGDGIDNGGELSVEEKLNKILNDVNISDKENLTHDEITKVSKEIKKVFNLDIPLDKCKSEGEIFGYVMSSVIIPIVILDLENQTKSKDGKDETQVVIVKPDNPNSPDDISKEIQDIKNPEKKYTLEEKVNKIISLQYGNANPNPNITLDTDGIELGTYLYQVFDINVIIGGKVRLPKKEQDVYKEGTEYEYVVLNTAENIVRYLKFKLAIQ